MDYCVGFIFNKNLDYILLVKKNRGPVNMSGKLNGIGGKLEKDEAGDCAMIRECREETGLNIEKWNFYCKLIVNNKDIVYFYYAVTDDIYDFKQLEDEKLAIYNVEYNEYQLFPRMVNLDWLIPMALNHHSKLDNVKSFEIKEIY